MSKSNESSEERMWERVAGEGVCSEFRKRGSLGICEAGSRCWARESYKGNCCGGSQETLNKLEAARGTSLMQDTTGAQEKSSDRGGQFPDVSFLFK